MSAKEFKVVLAGAFGSGRTTFASSIVKAKKDSKKIREFLYLFSSNSSYPVLLLTYDSQLHSEQRSIQSTYTPQQGK
jgi:hypothetical protein